LLDERIFFFGWKIAEGKDYRQHKIFTDIEYRHKFRFMPVFDIETQDKKPREGDREGSRGTKAYYTLGKPRRTPGIPDFQIPPRSQVSRGARSAADHFDLRPHQSSPNHTPLISAWHESRRTFSRNGQKRTYSPPPPSSSSRPVPRAAARFFRTPTISLDCKNEDLRRFSREKLIIFYYVNLSVHV